MTKQVVYMFYIQLQITCMLSQNMACSQLFAEPLFSIHLRFWESTRRGLNFAGNKSSITLNISFFVKVTTSLALTYSFIHYSLSAMPLDSYPFINFPVSLYNSISLKSETLKLPPLSLTYIGANSFYLSAACLMHRLVLTPMPTPNHHLLCQHQWQYGSCFCCCHRWSLCGASSVQHQLF